MARVNCMMRLFKEWRRNTEAASALEFAMLCPLLLTMLLGISEVGNGIIIDQKAIAASQIVADLIARNSSVTTTQINEAITAGQLAMAPYDTSPMGFDIVSIQYDKNANPTQVWRVTQNMVANNDGINGSIGLGAAGEGSLAVTVEYQYTPLFTSFVIGTTPMEEISYARGRQSAVISQD